MTTKDSHTAMVARLALAAVMLPHGWEMMANFEETMALLTGTWGHLPAHVAAAAILIEFVGSLALLFGLGGRVMAGLLGIVVFAAMTYTTNLGFLIDWQAGGMGFSFHVLALGLAYVVMDMGSGSLSLDRWITQRLEDDDVDELVWRTSKAGRLAEVAAAE